MTRHGRHRDPMFLSSMYGYDADGEIDGAGWAMSAQDGDLRPISSLVVAAGDGVVATGRLKRVAGGLRLAAVGAGLYDIVVEQAAPSVPLTLESAPACVDVVTVEGVWRGEGITEARIVPFREPVRFPDALGDRAEPPLVAGGRTTRAEVLAVDVMAVVDGLRESGLVSYVAHCDERGWFGIASATDPEPVRRGLRRVLGDSFLVVHSPWGLQTLDAIDRIFESDGVGRETLHIGRFIDPRGRLRSSALVRFVSPALARALGDTGASAVDLAAWIIPSSPDI